MGWHVQRWAAADSRAPVALLLHGTGSSSHTWRHVAPLLATHYQVLAPDLPGHAFTQTPRTQALSLPTVAAALADLLQQLSLQPTLVLAHSAGAAVALRMALDGHIRPELIGSINGAILPPPGAVGRWLLPAARVVAGNPLVAPLFSSWARSPWATRRLLNGTGSSIDAAGERCYEHLLAQHGSHAAGTLRLLSSWDLAPLVADLPALQTPLLLLVGDQDRTITPAHAQQVQRHVPTARRVVLAGGGHLVHEEDAGTAARVVDSINAHWMAPRAAHAKPAAQAGLAARAPRDIDTNRGRPARP